MGLLDAVKGLVSGNVGSLLQTLVGKLDGLKGEGKLDDIAEKALTQFKPVLEKYLGKSIDLDALMPKAKEFISGLSKAKLPDEVKGLVEKISKLLK